VKVLGNQIVGRLHEHTHGPDPARREVLRAVQQMKTRAEETEETPQQIITQSVSTITRDAAAKLPTVHHLRRDIRRVRQRANNPIPVPLTAEELVIPDQYKSTSDGQNFLLYDSGPAVNRILIFGTHENLNVLAQSPHWFLDGTFKTAPSIFFQLYTIHALVHERTIPCIYALLPNKSQATYTSLLQQLMTLHANLNPVTLMVDFEQAMINSIQQVLPNAQVKGCFYHFSQNLYRKIQEQGLQQRYQEDTDFAIKIRMVAALAFVPPNDVIAAFEELCEQILPDSQAFVDYFEDTYIGRPQRRGRRAPMFRNEVWNMFDRAEHELPRTNNYVEGWHRSFQSNVGSHHPNFWSFVDFIKREQALQQVYLTQALAGHAPQPGRKIYSDLKARVLTVVRDYENRNTLDYLRGIAHNLGF
jgi:hypothetical protein